MRDRKRDPKLALLHTNRHRRTTIFTLPPRTHLCSNLHAARQNSQGVMSSGRWRSMPISSLNAVIGHTSWRPPSRYIRMSPSLSCKVRLDHLLGTTTAWPRCSMVDSAIPQLSGRSPLLLIKGPENDSMIQSVDQHLCEPHAYFAHTADDCIFVCSCEVPH